MNVSTRCDGTAPPDYELLGRADFISAETRSLLPMTHSPRRNAT
jgi:hypothetical protein